MIQAIFSTITDWITASPVMASLGSLIWGAVSVIFSPCQIASIPLIIAYVGGQEKTANTKDAAFYSVAFSFGLFITITIVGFTCALLGRMLGDVGNFWQVIIGIILLWVAVGMIKSEACSSSQSLIYRFNLRGIGGAFTLGLIYGLIAGTCTFGFIAPILAVITIQKKLLMGLVYIVFFAIGHCLPIVAAGSSAAILRRLVENSSWYNAGTWFRRVAAVLISILGLYFIGNPFLGS